MIKTILTSITIGLPLALYAQHKQTPATETKVMRAASAERKVVVATGTSSTETGDWKPFFPLLQAAMNGNARATKLLLHAGADVNLSQNYFTALGLAALNNDLETANILLKAKANVNAQTGGRRLPILSIIVSHAFCLPMLDLLLTYNPDLNLSDIYGFTPLMWAIDRLNYNAAEKLLIAGADIALKNNYGLTAYEYAICKAQEPFCNPNAAKTYNKIAALIKYYEKKRDNDISDATTLATCVIS